MNWPLQHEHAWDLTPREAIAVQRELAPLVRQTPLDAPPQTVAGIDVSIRGDVAQPAIVVVDVRSGEVVDQAALRMEVAFPYVPGLLSFREMPALLPALERLTVRPDAFMLDAQGLAHPRRFGLACHLGVLTGVPSWGVAKSLLVGRFEGLGDEKGSRTALVHKGEEVGAAVRTRASTQPVYVSVGSGITLAEACALTLVLAPKYKIPLPTQLAHKLSRDIASAPWVGDGPDPEA